MKKTILLILFTVNIYANTITPNEVYSQVKLIQKKINTIHKFFDKNYTRSKQNTKIFNQEIQIKPRNTWQKTYEIMIKINILRINNNLPVIEPSNLQPKLHIDPILVYEQTQRVLTELDIFMLRKNITQKQTKLKKYTNKTPLDVFNALNDISYEIDIINAKGFTPSYVFGETIRIYDDLVQILKHLNIKDPSVPTKRDTNAKPSDTFRKSIKILNSIQYIKTQINLNYVNFNTFKKETITPSDVFGMTQMILSELQPIKAFIGLDDYITPAATKHTNKTPADVDQMMGWILRKIELLNRESILKRANNES